MGVTRCVSGPAYAVWMSQSGEWRVYMQAATITAGKPGYFEVNLSHQGDLRMAYTIPKPENAWHASPEKTVLPDKPYRLDFTMAPAANVRLRLFDSDGKPMANKEVWVTGPELPPSSSVLAGLKTDADGRASFEAPCKRFWFELPGADRGTQAKSDMVMFEKPGLTN